MKQIYIGYNKFIQSPHHPSFFQSHRSPWRNVCNRATKKAVHLYICIRNAEFILVQIFNSSKGLSFELKNLWDLRKIFVLSKNNNKDLDGLEKNHCVRWIFGKLTQKLGTVLLLTNLYIHFWIETIFAILKITDLNLIWHSHLLLFQQTFPYHQYHWKFS